MGHVGIQQCLGDPRIPPTGAEDVGPVIEESMSPHLDGNSELRDEADAHQPLDDSKQSMNMQMRITARYIRLYGYIPMVAPDAQSTGAIIPRQQSTTAMSADFGCILHMSKQ